MERLRVFTKCLSFLPLQAGSSIANQSISVDITFDTYSQAVSSDKPQFPSASAIADTRTSLVMVSHMEEEKEVELLLEEIPEGTNSKPRHWYVAGAGLTLLIVLGVAAKMMYQAPQPLGKFNMNTIQEWEEIPGIDKVVEHAMTLKLKQPLRNLNDLFYESQPAELPWIRTECVIDVIQGAAYLGQAIVFLYKAIEYDGLKCPNNSPAGCAASVAGFITSVTWIASYLSFAANACGAAVNSGALCAGDWTALMANFGEMATVGAAASEDCDFGKDWIALLNITGEPDAEPGWKQFIPAGASPTVETIEKVDALRTANRNRAFDLTQCVVADASWISLDFDKSVQ